MKRFPCSASISGSSGSFIQFVSDDPERSVVTFLLTAAVRATSQAETDHTSAADPLCEPGCRYVIQTRKHDIGRGGRVSG